MSLISFQFVLFVIVSALIYFICPKKYRWIVLLLASYAYYLIICNKYILYMMVTTLTTWAGGIAIGKNYKIQKATIKEHKKEWSRAERKAYKESMLKKSRRIMIAVLILNFGILGVLKYTAFGFEIAQTILNLLGSQVHFPDPGFLLPLGISFYTFQSMGYLIDVYQEKFDPEANLARFALFVSFFPQIIQGPIAMYEDLAGQLYEGHDFDFMNLKNGFALILWGVFKKMVLADRAVKLITFVTADSSQFSGTLILITALMYALQLYADFSGGIDIVRGIAEIFGIQMAENFRRPYFSTSLTEYWHRWHMTLGNWVRTYVFYPLSISRTFLKWGKNISEKHSKHLGKVLPTCVASLITFLIIGIWHGANGKYVAFGLWNGLVIMILEICRPWNDAMFDKLHVNREGNVYKVAAMIWTFILVLIGYYFDIAQNFNDAMSMIIRSITDFHLSDLTNIQMFLECGLVKADYFVILMAAILIFVVSVIQERSGRMIREMLWAKKTWVQWFVLQGAIVAIILFGYYGPNLDPSAFVYMQF